MGSELIVYSDMNLGSEPGSDPRYALINLRRLVSMRLPVNESGTTSCFTGYSREALIRKGILTPYQGTRWDFIQKGRQ